MNETYVAWSRAEKVFLEECRKQCRNGQPSTCDHKACATKELYEELKALRRRGCPHCNGNGCLTCGYTGWTEPRA
jgi:hypothetical protein